MLIERTLADAEINYYEKYPILLLSWSFFFRVLFSSDIEDLSDSEAANITSPVMEGSQEDSDLANDPDESYESIAPEYYDKEWRLVAVGVENADPVCVKLNDLCLLYTSPSPRDA